LAREHWWGCTSNPACQVSDIWSARLRPSYAIWRSLKVASLKLTLSCQNRQDFPNFHFSANFSDQRCLMQAERTVDPESLLTYPPGHLWRDKWTALSGSLSQAEKAPLALFGHASPSIRPIRSIYSTNLYHMLLYNDKFDLHAGGEGAAGAVRTRELRVARPPRRWYRATSRIRNSPPPLGLP